MKQRSTLLAALIVFGLVVGACGSGASEDTAGAPEPTSADTAASTEPETADTTAPSEDDDSGGQTDPPPAENSGTVTWGDQTFEITEFFLCETVNPAFEGDFNIQMRLPDGTSFGMMGNVDDFSADHQGLILGDLPDQEKATELSLEVNGRNLSGSGQTSQGPIEFSFDC